MKSVSFVFFFRFHGQVKLKTKKREREKKQTKQTMSSRFELELKKKVRHFIINYKNALKSFLYAVLITLFLLFSHHLRKSFPNTAVTAITLKIIITFEFIINYI